jgi:hypothetical protein
MLIIRDHNSGNTNKLLKRQYLTFNAILCATLNCLLMRDHYLAYRNCFFLLSVYITEDTLSQIIKKTHGE